MKKLILGIIRKLGYDIVKTGADAAKDSSDNKSIHHEMEDEFHRFWEIVKPYTMTSIERGYGLYKAVDYVCRNGIDGIFVECGVWRGGSSMLAALTFLSRDKTPDLFLHDTFSGMSEPTDKDRHAKTGQLAIARWKNEQKDGHVSWCYASLDEVKENMSRTGYPESLIHYRIGKVEDTIPESDQEPVAILRLDTDWYESTKWELENLYPRLVPCGVLILDDYGHWAGARQAMDEYVAENGVSILLNRMDYTGHIGVKT